MDTVSRPRPIRTIPLLGAACLSLVAGYAAAAEKPCQQIRQACLDAGFTQGGGKEGTGLFVDCIDPIMQSVAQPAKVSKPLPTVDAQLVSACKAANPKFGGKQGAGDQSSGESASPPAPAPQGASPAPAQ
jgi:hypothetical protein